MRSDLDEQLERLADWMEAETGERLRPDLTDLVVDHEEVATGGRRRLVLAAAAIFAFAAGALTVLLVVDRSDGPVAVVTPQTSAPTTAAAPSTAAPPETTTTTEPQPEIDGALAVETAEAFMATLDGSESAWSMVVLDASTGDVLAGGGEAELELSAGSAIHIVPVAAAVAAGYGDGREIDGTGPCDGPNGEIRNFGNGRGGPGTLRDQVMRSSRCAMTRLDQELRPSWILARAGLPHSDDLIGESQVLELAQLAELVRALTGDGVFSGPDGPVRLVEPETADVVRDYYESNARSGTATNMRQPDGRRVVGITGTNEDFVHSVAVLRSDELVVAAVIEDPDGANSGRNLTGGSFPAMIVGEVHAAVAPPFPPEPDDDLVIGTIERRERPELSECFAGTNTGRRSASVHDTAEEALRAVVELAGGGASLPAGPYVRIDLGDGTVAYGIEGFAFGRYDVLVDVEPVDGGWQVAGWERTSC
ncbi:MAG: hypothetical protein AAFZ07_12560 [Actinomycetota bacterium]